RVGLVFEHDTWDLAPRLGCAGELIEPRAADAGAARRGILEAGHAFGTVIADEITRGEAEHRPRVLDRASGDDRYRSTLRERAQALLHLVRHPRVPRPVDDRSQCAVDIEREQRLAHHERADARQTVGSQRVLHFTPTPAVRWCA